MAAPTSISPRPVIVDTSRSPHARLHPLPINNVQLRDEFWQPRRDINRDVTLPAQYEQCERNGYFNNLRRAAGQLDAPFEGLRWNDSDVFKWLEAASSALADEAAPDSLRDRIEHVVGLIEAAQGEDGYLHSYFQFDKAGERFTYLEHSHELYNFGHFLQAAVAHFRATGDERLLTVARKLGDFVHRTFGWQSEGKFEYTDGHEEIEMALFELGRATGDPKHFEAARFFVDVHGPHHPVPIAAIDHIGQAYHQSHKPLREQDAAVGHAVRAMYFYCGGADYVLENGDEAIRAALDRLWYSTTQRKMYVTGGIGSRHDGESFGDDYELPNVTAYCESCAAIGLVMWAWRMLHIEPHGRYADVLERALYNGVLSGLSLDGQKHFYVNPLESDGTHRRQEWFGCACCPPNIARLMSQLPGYFAGVSEAGVWLHLYAQSRIETQSPDGQTVALDIVTRYPWQGDIGITVQASGEFSLFLRQPSWCDNPTLQVNGEATQIAPQNGYIEVHRDWQSGDKAFWTLPMEPRRLECRPEVAENRGSVALSRGPLVYCLEACDHPNAALPEIALPPASEIKAEWRGDLLNGVQVLQAEATTAAAAENWDQRDLYRFVDASKSAGKVFLTAIPYYAWANRGAGAMRVWIPVAT